jgi:hypothetical protein
VLATALASQALPMKNRAPIGMRNILRVNIGVNICADNSGLVTVGKRTTMRAIP